MMLTYHTGTRPGEVLAISFDDINYNIQSISIHQSLAVRQERLQDGTWSPREFVIQEYLKKNAQPRKVIIPSECLKVIDTIREILKEKNIERNTLFQVQTPQNLEMKLYKLCDELKIPRRSPNKLRKTNLSILYNAHAPEDFIRRQADHQSIQTTRNNYVFTNKRDSETAQKLNEIFT